MKYHLSCFIKNQRIAQRPSNEYAEELNIINVMCDLEIIDVVKWSLTDNEDTVLTMNDIQTAYLDILRENSIKIVEGKRYKPYLQQLIIDNIENVHFNKPNDITKSEQIFSKAAMKHSLSGSAKNKDNLQVILDASKILRNEINTTHFWSFKGTFDDYEDPPLLLWFCRYLIQGHINVKNERKCEQVERSASIILHNTLCNLSRLIDK